MIFGFITALVSDEDRGFDDDVDHHLDDDDFFIGGLVATNNTNTSASTTSSNNTSRGRKEQQQENIKDGETENHPVPMSKAELELLMMPDNPSLHTRNHFDAKDVIKAEKSGKNKKKKKARGNKFDEEGVQDGFEIDTADSRFKAVFEEHEFALDPTNPRFKKTKSMQQILSERRDRASISGGDDNSTIVSGLPPSSTTSSSLPKASESDNLKLLVDSVKRKSTSALTRTANHQGKRSRKE